MLPAWLDPLYEGAEMRAVDSWAVEHGGVPSLDLMERAGLGLARAAAAMAAGADPIAIVIGKGNNGGDGLVAARQLRRDGHVVRLLAACDPAELQGDARANLECLTGDGPQAFDPALLQGAACIVDCLLGTGFEGTPREPVAGAIEAINATGAPVLACDVPSGVDAATGRVEGPAVKADATATFHGSKIGLHVAPGKHHSGAVQIIDIGVPRGAPAPTGAGLISGRVLELVPARAAEGSKFTSGVVAVAGGARGLTGAPCMTAMAAQRTGAGYVQVAVPASLEPILEGLLLEPMTVGLPEADGSHVPEGAERVIEMAERSGAAVLGPGLGRAESALAFARRVAQALEGPLLIDADGLNAHSGALESLAGRNGPTVLTPHAGELARLLDTTSDSVAADRLASAREAARRSGCVVILKGDDSIVAAPGGLVAISPGATPGLATAGTGDVLSGVVAALMAKGLEAFEAAAAGVLAHAHAGIAAARRVGAEHTVARDVIDALPAAFSAGAPE
ncbi:MAG: ADP-dependent NAD(P)H-hydrate dehydratase / NAD(P)H-hydrate epimerase [Thermoleophilaceae bacterium]|nr:ADP-dependent NAD(P)H-hydrate dehydratase / NAD(P)H-hydrate epimerase [Thermoleophilaceae bacterium]